MLPPRRCHGLIAVGKYLRTSEHHQAMKTHGCRRTGSDSRFSSERVPEETFGSLIWNGPVFPQGLLLTPQKITIHSGLPTEVASFSRQAATAVFSISIGRAPREQGTMNCC